MGVYTTGRGPSSEKSPVPCHGGAGVGSRKPRATRASPLQVGQRQVVGGAPRPRECYQPESPRAPLGLEDTAARASPICGPAGAALAGNHLTTVPRPCMSSVMCDGCARQISILSRRSWSVASLPQQLAAGGRPGGADRGRQRVGNGGSCEREALQGVAPLLGEPYGAWSGLLLRRKLRLTWPRKCVIVIYV